MSTVDRSDLVYGGQAAAQVFQNPDLLPKALEFLNIPETLKARTVCKDWDRACHIKLLNTLCCELEPKLAPYLEYVGITFKKYLLDRNIDLLKLTTKELFLYLDPIKVNVSIGRCELPNVGKINSESVEQDIRTHITDSVVWPGDFRTLAKRMGCAVDCKIDELIMTLHVQNNASPELKPKLNQEIINQLLESYLPIAPKIVEFINPIGNMPYFYLNLVKRDITKKAKKVRDEAGLCVWEYSSCIKRGLHAGYTTDSKFDYSVIKNCRSKSFPVALFGLKPEDLRDAQGYSYLSLKHVIGESFYIPIDGKVHKFKIWEKGEFENDLGSCESSSEGDYEVYNTDEDGCRCVKTVSWWDFLFEHPYLAEDLFIPNSQKKV